MRTLLPLLLAAILTLSAADGDQQLASIGDLKLASGETIRDCRVGYRTIGKLNDAKSNVIVWPTWFSGRTENLLPFVQQHPAMKAVGAFSGFPH